MPAIRRERHRSCRDYTALTSAFGARRRARFRASAISAFTRVFRRAMRAHYSVAALAARFARQRGARRRARFRASIRRAHYRVAALAARFARQRGGGRSLALSVRKTRDPEGGHHARDRRNADQRCPPPRRDRHTLTHGANPSRNSGTRMILALPNRLFQRGTRPRDLRSGRTARAKLERPGKSSRRNPPQARSRRLGTDLRALGK